MSKENKNPKSCEIVIPESYSMECNNNFQNPKHSFKNGKYYKNDKYYGDVIYSNEKIIQVECKNDNIFMQGQIITIQLVNS
jgi:hypothetical protein